MKINYMSLNGMLDLEISPEKSVLRINSKEMDITPYQEMLWQHFPEKFKEYIETKNSKWTCFNNLEPVVMRDRLEVSVSDSDTNESFKASSTEEAMEIKRAGVTYVLMMFRFVRDIYNGIPEAIRKNSNELQELDELLKELRV